MERLFKKKIGIRGAIAWQHMSSYLVLKIGYINKTHTHIHKVELKTLYFNSYSPLQKRFLRSYLRKRLTIDVSALVLDELMVLSDPVIPAIMEVKGCWNRNRWHFCRNRTVWNGVRPTLRCLDITCLCMLSVLLSDISETEQDQLMSTPQEQNVDWENGACCALI